MIHSLLLLYHKFRYHLQIIAQNFCAKVVVPNKDYPENLPPVTLFISSFNTLNALQVTLGSLERTKQKSDRIVIADNHSNDGSLEFLRSYVKNRPWVRLIENNELKLHGKWMDEILQSCETPYLFFIDSDILFLGKDLISQCVDYMERNPHCFLFASERRDGGIEKKDKTVLSEPAIATWFFGIRTSIRERVQESFLVRYPNEQPEIDGRKIVSDTGAKYLQAMNRMGLAVHYFPWCFRVQFYHYGSLSWIYMVDSVNRWTLMKKYQLQDLQRRASTYKDLWQEF